jgi:hypothetical protein
VRTESLKSAATQCKFGALHATESTISRATAIDPEAVRRSRPLPWSEGSVSVEAGLPTIPSGFRRGGVNSAE